MTYSKAKLQSSGVEAYLKHVRQMFAYPDTAVDFNETCLYES